MKRFSLLLALISIFGVNAAQGQFFKKLVESAGNIVNTGVKVTTAPYETLINTGRVVTGNAQPKDIYKPYQELAQSAGRSTTAVNSLVADPQRFLYQKAAEFAARTGGRPGEFIFDVTTFSQQLQQELANAGVQNAGLILQGQNPLQIAGAPLAAGLRAARDRHAANARPIPEDVKIALRGHFPESTLNRAKYTIGTVQITLPNFINRSKFGDIDAVVVDDIIVFKNDPGTFAQNAYLWAHEMTHVRQYEAWGLENFAYRYTVNHSAVENEADQNGLRIAQSSGRGSTIRNVMTSQNAVSFDMTGYNSGVNYQQNPERYIAQCVFPYDPYRVNYLLTNYGRIIVVNPMTGEWLHIGHATPPRVQGVSWTYQTPNLAYGVLPNGAIYMDRPIFDPWGRVVGWQPTQIGHVIRFE